MLRKRKLKGRLLTASKVPISNCLLVENLNSMTTEDTVALYFENKCNNGGPVEKVEMATDGNKCFVYFESHEGDNNYVIATGIVVCFFCGGFCCCCGFYFESHGSDDECSGVYF